MTVSYGRIGTYSLTPWLLYSSLLASLVSKHPCACPSPLSSTFNVWKVKVTVSLAQSAVAQLLL